MAFIAPSREQYQPELDLKVAGQFFAKCRRVEQGLPNKQFPGKTLVAIEFEIVDKRHPALLGKRAAIVCGESVFVNRTTNKPTILMEHAKRMGVEHPETGFDPEEFVGNIYYVTCELYGERAFVRVAVALPPNYGGQQPAKEVPAPLPVDQLPQLDGDPVPF